MSNLFNIFEGVYGQKAMWLESRATLAEAQQRVDQISALLPGRYFVFNIASGAVVYQVQAPSRFSSDVAIVRADVKADASEP
jgi:hypothetical protein